MTTEERYMREKGLTKQHLNDQKKNLIEDIKIFGKQAYADALWRYLARKAKDDGKYGINKKDGKTNAIKYMGLSLYDLLQEEGIPLKIIEDVLPEREGTDDHLYPYLSSVIVHGYDLETYKKRFFDEDDKEFVNKLEQLKEKLYSIHDKKKDLESVVYYIFSIICLEWRANVFKNEEIKTKVKIYPTYCKNKQGFNFNHIEIRDILTKYLKKEKYAEEDVDEWLKLGTKNEIIKLQSFLGNNKQAANKYCPKPKSNNKIEDVLEWFNEVKGLKDGWFQKIYDPDDQIRPEIYVVDQILNGGDFEVVE